MIYELHLDCAGRGGCCQATALNCGLLVLRAIQGSPRRVVLVAVTLRHDAFDVAQRLCLAYGAVGSMLG